MAMQATDSVKAVHEHDKYAQDINFQQLISTRKKVASVLTALTLVTYFTFILLMAFGKEILSATIAPNITIGIPIGAAVIVISWLLTFTYANWANKKYDPLVEEVKERMGG
ncbi:MAG TPA: DUF485 domain-containing protein [Candidatus Aquicultor sp.]